MQKNADYPKKFNSIEEAQEMLRNNPEAFTLTRQDDTGEIIQERIEQKIGKIKRKTTGSDLEC